MNQLYVGHILHSVLMYLAADSDVRSIAALACVNRTFERLVRLDTELWSNLVALLNLFFKCFYVFIFVNRNPPPQVE